VPNAGTLRNTALLWGAALAGAVSAVGDQNSDEGRAWAACSPGDVRDWRQLQTLLVLVGGEGLEILHKALPT